MVDPAAVEHDSVIDKVFLFHVSPVSAQRSNAAPAGSVLFYCTPENKKARCPKAARRFLLLLTSSAETLCK